MEGKVHEIVLFIDSNRPGLSVSWDGASRGVKALFKWDADTAQPDGGSMHSRVGSRLPAIQDRD